MVAFVVLDLFVWVLVKTSPLGRASVKWLVLCWVGRSNLSSMLHGSEIWPVRKENKVALQWAEMKMVRWMCGVEVKDKSSSKGLRERLGLDDIISVLQQNRLHWYWRVAKRLCEELYGVWSGGCQSMKLTKEDLVRLCKNTVNWTGRMLWIIVDGGSR